MVISRAPGGAERVAERDRAAARVEPGRVGAELAAPGQRHRRERLVDLVVVDLVDASGRRACSTFSVAGIGPVSIRIGSSPSHREGVEPGARAQAERRGRLARS